MNRRAAPWKVFISVSLSVLVVLSAATAARGATAVGAATLQPRGGTLHTAFDAAISTLDPAVGYDPFAWTGEHAIFDGLLDYASGSGAAGTRLVPRLATAMPTVSANGLVYTFTLRRGVHFQAPVSREVTADDVRYSIERALSPNTPSAAMYQSSFWSPLAGVQNFWNKKAAHISGIVVSGRYGISFHLTSPDRAFLNVLAMPFTSVVPKEWVARWAKNFSNHALGTGPFILSSINPAARIVLVRNPHYFRPGVPLVDRVIIDLNVADHLQIQRVQAGALDLAGNLITSSDYLSLKNDPTWSRDIAYAPDIAVTYLAFNLKDKPFAGNLDLRRAVNMAIDKPFILRLINGRGLIMNGVLPPTMPGANPHFTYYAYNPTAAQSLLRKAGYRPGQLTVPMTYQTQYGDDDKIAQEIKSELGAIGINITLKPISGDNWYSNVRFTQKEGPLTMDTWGQDYPDPSDFFDPILSCGASSNAAFYCNPAVDALGNRARGNPDNAARYAQYRRMETMVMADAPWAPIYDDVLYDFHGPRLGGFYIPPIWPFNYADYYIK